MKKLKVLSGGILIAVLTACGGGGSSSGTATPLAGTAAIGAPMADATVTLKDSEGNIQTATANSSGEFEFKDVGSLKAPFILKAVATVGGEEKSLFSALDEKPTAGKSGVINVTPLTNAIVAQLAPTGDASALFEAPTQLATAVTATKVNDATAKTVEAVKAVLTQLNIDVSQFDPMKSSFKADSTGKDKLFDLVKFQPSATGDLEITNKATGIATTVAKADTKEMVAAKPLAAISTEVLSFDFTKLKTLLTALQTKEGFAASMDENFLNDGMGKTAFLNEINQFFDYFKVIDYVVGGCDKDTSVCDGTVTIKNFGEKDETWIDKERFPVKYVNGAWKLYGNQSPIAFNLRQVIQIQTATTTKPKFDDLAKANGFQVGLQLDVPNPTFKTDTVKAYFCTDTKTTCSSDPFISLKGIAGTEYYVDAVTESGNFIEIKDSSSVEVVKEKYLAGKLWVKIVKGNDSYTFRPEFKFFTSDDVKAIVERSLNMVKFDEINTSSFTPAKRLEMIRTSISSPVSSFMELDEGKLMNAIKDAKVTVSEVCVANANPAGCSASDAKFSYIFQNFRDEFMPVSVWFSANKP